MNEQNRIAVQILLDFIYDSCRFDSSGDERSDEEKLRKYAWYIGWLEGNLLEQCDDDQVQVIMDRIKIRTFEDAVDEVVLHDDEDGSFY